MRPAERFWAPRPCLNEEPLVASLLLVVRPGAPSSDANKERKKFVYQMAPHAMLTQKAAVIFRHSQLRRFTFVDGSMAGGEVNKNMVSYLVSCYTHKGLVGL